MLSSGVVNRIDNMGYIVSTVQYVSCNSPYQPEMTSLPFKSGNARVYSAQTHSHVTPLDVFRERLGNKS